MCMSSKTKITVAGVKKVKISADPDNGINKMFLMI